MSDGATRALEHPHVDDLELAADARGAADHPERRRERAGARLRVSQPFTQSAATGPLVGGGCWGSAGGVATSTAPLTVLTGGAVVAVVSAADGSGSPSVHATRANPSASAAVAANKRAQAWPEAYGPRRQAFARFLDSVSPPVHPPHDPTDGLTRASTPLDTRASTPMPYERVPHDEPPLFRAGVLQPLALVGATLYACTGAGRKAPVASPATTSVVARETRWPIKRVVYVMMENRASTFGWFRGANGTTVGVKYGQRCRSRPARPGSPATSCTTAPRT